MSTVVDYIGRTVDVLAFQGVSPDTEVLLSQSLVSPGEGGEICTGVQKLAQRWLIEFLTIQGTLLYLPVRGCPFMGQLARGELHTSLDAEQAFYLSANQVRSNLQAEEDTTMPDDERFASSALDSIAVGGGSLTLTVTITSLAGNTAAIILPITVRVH